MMRGLLLEMFALSQKRTFAPHKSCPLYPENDINDVSGCAATAGERDGSGSAFAPRIQRRSTGLDYRNRDCPPKYCLYGSSLRTSDTGSPNTHYLWRPRSSRTMGRCKPELVVNQQSRQQEQRWQLESRGSSSASILDAITTPSGLSVFAADIISQWHHVRFTRKQTFALHYPLSGRQPSAAFRSDRTKAAHVATRLSKNSNFPPPERGLSP